MKNSKRLYLLTLVLFQSTYGQFQSTYDQEEQPTNKGFFRKISDYIETRDTRYTLPALSVYGLAKYLKNKNPNDIYLNKLLRTPAKYSLIFLTLLLAKYPNKLLRKYFGIQDDIQSKTIENEEQIV